MLHPERNTVATSSQDNQPCSRFVAVKHIYAHQIHRPSSKPRPERQISMNDISAISAVREQILANATVMHTIYVVLRRLPTYGSR